MTNCFIVYEPGRESDPLQATFFYFPPSLISLASMHDISLFPSTKFRVGSRGKSGKDVGV